VGQVFTLLLGCLASVVLGQVVGETRRQTTAVRGEMSKEEEEKPSMLKVAPADLIPTDNPFGELRSTLDVDQDAERKKIAPGVVPDAISSWLPLTRKLLLTAVLLGAFIGLPYALPTDNAVVAWLRLLDVPEVGGEDEPFVAPLPVGTVGEASLPGPTMDQQARAEELDKKRDTHSPIAHRNTPGPAVDEGEVKHPVEDPKGNLDKFFAKLVRVENKEPGAVARILYFGDSIVASDFVTGKLRRLYQTRFGDAGHGYALVANAWPGWFHIDVSRKASQHWKVSRCVTPYAEDGFYGLGCVSFVSRVKAATFTMGTATRDKWGREVTSFELEYFQQPGGGEIAFKLDGERHSVLSTDGEAKLSYHTIEVPAGPHELQVRTLEDKPVRLFGMRMARDVPGVTLSALGITGARCRFLDKQNDEHWAEVLKAAKPDLVIFAFGSNEITDGSLYLDENGQKSKTPFEDYRRDVRKVMKQVSAAVPDSSWMLVGPPDMASKKAEWGHSRPAVSIIAKSEKQLAEEEGWAFFDQLAAMGGTGSMWAWIKSGLGNNDMFHPTGSGGNVLGRLQYKAVMQAFEKYKDAHR